MVSIAFTGGGTGGHIYPGLAIIESLKSLTPCRVLWIGCSTGMDKSIVETAAIPFYGIPAGKFRRYVSIKNITDISNIFNGFFKSRAILARERPALLFSKGGFVSVPPCMAAFSLGIPVFTHESDYTPGLATKLNILVARKIFTAYSDTITYLPAKMQPKAFVTGNPVRKDFYQADPARGRAFLQVSENERILLVLGGSQGAQQINELVWENLQALTRHYLVVHQTGHQQHSPVPVSERYRPYPYITDALPHVLAASELVVGRSGAGTVWEAATAGKPMILIPLAGSATRGDQVENANYFKRAGAAEVLVGDMVQGQILVDMVEKIAEDTELQNQMANASKAIGSIHGADIIARMIIEEIGV